MKVLNRMLSILNEWSKEEIPDLECWQCHRKPESYEDSKKWMYVEVSYYHSNSPDGGVAGRVGCPDNKSIDVLCPKCSVGMEDRRVNQSARKKEYLETRKNKCLK